MTQGWCMQRGATYSGDAGMHDARSTHRWQCAGRTRARARRRDLPAGHMSTLVCSRNIARTAIWSSAQKQPDFQQQRAAAACFVRFMVFIVHIFVSPCFDCFQANNIVSHCFDFCWILFWKTILLVIVSHLIHCIDIVYKYCLLFFSIVYCPLFIVIVYCLLFELIVHCIVYCLLLLFVVCCSLFHCSWYCSLCIVHCIVYCLLLYYLLLFVLGGSGKPNAAFDWGPRFF